MGSKGQKRTVIVVLEHVFKAKKVTFWEVSRRFAENAFFWAENRFFAEIRIFARNFAFLVKSCTFPVLGHQKTSQKLVFIKGFEQGARKGALGAQKCIFLVQNRSFS